MPTPTRNISGARRFISAPTSFSDDMKKTVAWCQFAVAVPMRDITCRMNEVCISPPPPPPPPPPPLVARIAEALARSSFASSRFSTAIVTTSPDSTSAASGFVVDISVSKKSDSKVLATRRRRDHEQLLFFSPAILSAVNICTSVANIVQESTVDALPGAC